VTLLVNGTTKRQEPIVMKNPMNSSTLKSIRELYHLWKPVYPYLAKFILEHYDRQDGTILEIGPFCGTLFALNEMQIGDSLFIAAFPPEMADFYREETRNQKAEARIRVIGADSSLAGFEENSVDLAIFRGAFFFPSLFQVNLPQVYRILKPGGVALVGGGFGKSTPDSVMKAIGKRSRDLNLRIGKVEIEKEALSVEIRALSGSGRTEIVSEGGIWVLMNK
jgi:SAM-dependent methyltransferase